MSQDSPFFGLRRDKLSANPVKQGDVTASGTTTMATVSGAGTMVEMHLVLNPKNSIIRDGHLQFFVDGESSPGVDFDLGCLGNHWLTAATQVWTDHHSCAAANQQLNLVWKFPVPYQNGLVIKLLNDSSDTGNFWIQPVVTPGVTSSLRLKSANVPNMSSLDVSGGSITMLDAGGSGVIVFHSMILSGGTNTSSWESPVEVYVDGESASSYKSSGTEDWFQDAFYWMMGAPQSHPWGYVSAINRSAGNVAVNAGLDLWNLHGGIPFATGVKLTWNTTDYIRGSINLAYLVLYYLDTGQGV